MHDCAGGRRDAPGDCQTPQPPGHIPSPGVDPSDELLAGVAALGEVHGLLDEPGPGFVRDRVLVELAARHGDACLDTHRLVGLQPALGREVGQRGVGADEVDGGQSRPVELGGVRADLDVPPPGETRPSQCDAVAVGRPDVALHAQLEPRQAFDHGVTPTSVGVEDEFVVGTPHHAYESDHLSLRLEEQ